MKRFQKLFCYLIIALLITMGFPATALAYDEVQAEVSESYVAKAPKEKTLPDQAVIKFKKSTAKEKKNKFISDIAASEVGELDKIDIKVVKLPKGKTLEDVKGLAKKYQEVESVEAEYVSYASYVPNDPMYKTNQPQLGVMKMPAVWDTTKGSSVRVAVLDTGVNAAHPDLVGRVVGGYDFVNSDNNPTDDNGHGTRVAGIIAANGDNTIGIAGMNWNVQILPVKVMGATGSGTTSAMAKGIIYAVDNGAKIINMSIGTQADSVAVRDAINYAASRNVIVVAAAGNNNATVIDYPARYDSVIGVGAYSGSAKASYSNAGTGLTLCSIGSMYSTVMSGAYGTCSGTSFATPAVAGGLSLVKGINPDLTPGEAMDLVIASAVPVGTQTGWTESTGYGKLDFELLMKNAQATSVPVVPVDTTAPKLTLSGLSHYAVEYYAPFNEYKYFLEAGISAIDDVDGDITGKVVIAESIDTTVPGEYKVNYSVKDAAGNEAKAERSVTVNEPPPVAEPEPEIMPEEPPAESTPPEGSGAIELPGEEAPAPEEPAAPVMVATRDTITNTGAMKSGSAKHTVSVNDAGDLDFSLGWDTAKTVFNLKVYDPAGKVVASTNYTAKDSITSTSLHASAAQAGKYTVEVILTSGKGNNNYTLKSTLPEYMKIGEGQTPLDGLPLEVRMDDLEQSLADAKMMLNIAIAIAVAALLMNLIFWIRRRRQTQ